MLSIFYHHNLINIILLPFLNNARKQLTLNKQQFMTTKKYVLNINIVERTHIQRTEKYGMSKNILSPKHWVITVHTSFFFIAGTKRGCVELVEIAEDKCEDIEVAKVGSVGTRCLCKTDRCNGTSGLRLMSLPVLTILLLFRSLVL